MPRKIYPEQIQQAGASLDDVLKWNGTKWTPGVGGGVGVTDGDKGDISVSGTGTSWTIDNQAVTLAKMANLASSTIIGRYSLGSGAPEAITIGQGLQLTGGTLSASSAIGSIVPTMVQEKHYRGASGTNNVSFDSAPTAGNLLVAIFSGAASGLPATTPNGWQLLDVYWQSGGSGAVNNFNTPFQSVGCYYRWAEAGETVGPHNFTGTDLCNISMYELVNAKSISARVVHMRQYSGSSTFKLHVPQDASRAAFRIAHIEHDGSQNIDFDTSSNVVSKYQFTSGGSENHRGISAVLSPTFAGVLSGTASGNLTYPVALIVSVGGSSAGGWPTDSTLLGQYTVSGGKIEITGLDLSGFSHVELEIIGLKGSTTFRPNISLWLDGVKRNTSGDYAYNLTSYSSAASSDNAGATAATSIPLASNTSTSWQVDGSVADARWHGSVRFHDLGSTGHRGFSIHGTITEGPTGSSFDVQGGGAVRVGGSVTGFTVNTIAGDTLVSGTLYIRGYYKVQGSTNGISDGDKGDITTSSAGSVWTIDSGAVSLAKMANLAANSFIGNNTGSAATPIALTQAQATALLNPFTSALQGMAPASGGGTLNFLRADGTWAAPPGGGGGSGGSANGSFVYIERQVVTGATNVDINLPDDYDGFHIEFYLAPNTDNVGLTAQITDDSFVTVEAGASDYRYTQLRSSASSTGVTSSNGGTSISILTGQGNSTNEFSTGHIDVINAKEATATSFIIDSNYVTTAAAYGQGRVFADYLGTQSVNGIRIAASSGTLTGYYKIWGRLRGVTARTTRILQVQHTAAQNTNGGGQATGSDLTRTLNTVAINDIPGASLSSNQITLPAGTYWIDATVPFFRTGRSRAWLYNVTDASVAVLGASIFSDDSVDGDQTVCKLRGTFTITGTKVFEIRSRVQVSNTTNGAGVESNYAGTEIYTDIIISNTVFGVAADGDPLDSRSYAYNLLTQTAGVDNIYVPKHTASGFQTTSNHADNMSVSFTVTKTCIVNASFFAVIERATGNTRVLIQDKATGSRIWPKQSGGGTGTAMVYSQTQSEGNGKIIDFTASIEVAAGSHEWVVKAEHATSTAATIWSDRCFSVSLPDTSSSGGGGGALAIADEGVEEGSAIDRINFTGSGVSVSVTGGEATVDVSGGGGTWGSVTGTLSAQTDLQAALDAKLNLSAIVNGVEGFCSGMPDAAEVVGGNIAPNAYTFSASNSVAKSLVAATASTVFTIKNNGTNIGTVTFGASATTGTVVFTSSSVSMGDFISIHAPTPQDTTLSGVAFLLRN